MVPFLYIGTIAKFHFLLPRCKNEEGRGIQKLRAADKTRTYATRPLSTAISLTFIGASLRLENRTAGKHYSQFCE